LLKAMQRRQGGLSSRDCSPDHCPICSREDKGLRITWGREAGTLVTGVCSFLGKPGGQQTREHFWQQCVCTDPSPGVFGE
jgi:hypothetical protein